MNTRPRIAAECRFCELMDDDATISWNERLFETEHFVVIPSKGALVPGWLMIVPRAHVLATSQLGVGGADELSAVCARVSAWVAATYSAPTLFEHGAGHQGTRFGCGIDHAHLHVVPLGFSLLDAARATYDLDWIDGHAPWHANQAAPYLALQEPGGPWTCARPNDVPSQFFRRVIATTLGLANEYHYDEFPRDEASAHATLAAHSRPIAASP